MDTLTGGVLQLELMIVRHVLADNSMANVRVRAPLLPHERVLLAETSADIFPP
jgi:hypothetical protein